MHARAPAFTRQHGAVGTAPEERGTEAGRQPRHMTGTIPRKAAPGAPERNKRSTCGTTVMTRRALSTASPCSIDKSRRKPLLAQVAEHRCQTLRWPHTSAIRACRKPLAFLPTAFEPAPASRGATKTRQMKPSPGVMGSAYTPTEALSSMAARALFYPSLLYNVTRSSLQSDWHWFDEITEVTRTSAARAMPDPVLLL